jgi:hypothetical protein
MREVYRIHNAGIEPAAAGFGPIDSHLYRISYRSSLRFSPAFPKKCQGFPDCGLRESRLVSPSLEANVRDPGLRFWALC